MSCRRRSAARSARTYSGSSSLPARRVDNGLQKIVGGKSLAGSGGGNFLYTPGEFINFDSLGVEAGGNVCVASMVRPGISVIGTDGDLVEFVDIDSDGDPGITNICWGGEDMKTAYITASSTGKLLKVDWPRPGASLNFAAGATK